LAGNSFEFSEEIAGNSFGVIIFFAVWRFVSVKNLFARDKDVKNLSRHVKNLKKMSKKTIDLNYVVRV